MSYVCMTRLRDWNSHQLRVFRRYCRRYGLTLTPEATAWLGARYAVKHATERPRATPEAPAEAVRAGDRGPGRTRPLRGAPVRRTR